MKLKIYRGKQDLWRSRIVARNGRIVASGESYKRKRDMMKTIGKLINMGQFAKVEEMK